MKSGILSEQGNEWDQGVFLLFVMAFDDSLFIVVFSVRSQPLTATVAAVAAWDGTYAQRVVAGR